MARGPMTLLVDPVAGTYQDAAGVHDLPHTYPSLGPNERKGQFGDGDGQHYSTSIVSNWGVGDKLNLFEHPFPSLYNDNLAWLTVTGASKTANASIGGFVLNGTLDGEKPLFPSTFYSQYGGRWGARLTASAATIDATQALAADASGNVMMGFFVGNGGDTQCQASILVNGVVMAGPFTLGAGEIAFIHGAGIAVSGSQQAGVRFTNAVVGKNYFLTAMIAYSGWNLPEELVPGWLTSSLLADGTFFHVEVGDLGASDGAWVGTAFASKSRLKASHWYVPLERMHFPNASEASIFGFARAMFPNEKSGDDLSLFFAPFNVGRPRSGYDGDTYNTNINFECGGSFSDSTQIRGLGRVYGHYLNPFIVKGSAQVPDMPRSALKSRIFAYVGYNIDRGVMQVALNDTFVENTNNLGWSTDLHDWPFNGLDAQPAGEPENGLYLSPGAPLDSWIPSFVASHVTGIASRMLTDAERAYLQNPDSVWHLNLFAEPISATISGLDEPIYRGDDREVTVTVLDADGDPVPLYGHTVWFTAKLSSRLLNEGDSAAYIRGKAIVGNDGVINASSTLVQNANAASGSVTFAIIAPAVFESGGPIERLEYDVQVQDIEGHITTVLRDTMTITQDVTRERP